MKKSEAARLSELDVTTQTMIVGRVVHLWTLAGEASVKEMAEEIGCRQSVVRDAIRVILEASNNIEADVSKALEDLG